MFDLVKQAYGDTFTNDILLNNPNGGSQIFYNPTGPQIKYTYIDKNGEPQQDTAYVYIAKTRLLDPSALDAPSEKAYMKQWLDTGDNLEQAAKQYNAEWESVQEKLVRKGA